MPISVRMPQSFFPPSTRSFVHLISGYTPLTAKTARAAATAAMAVRCMSASGFACGRRITLKYRPPGGETKVRPRRPFPAVWQPVRMAVPSGAPSAARRLQALFVESTLGTAVTSVCHGWPDRCARTRAVSSRSGTDASV